MPANKLSPELAAKYAPIDYVSVNHSAGHHSKVTLCGETLDRKVVSAVFNNSETGIYYDDAKIDKKGYYIFYMAFRENISEGDNIGIVEIYIPTEVFTAQAKNAEYNQDILLITVVAAIFAVLYIITNRWIRTLESSVDFLRKITSGITPEKEIHFGRTLRLSGLERQLNILREINLDRTSPLEEEDK